MKFLLLAVIAHRPDPATGHEKSVAERLQSEVGLPFSAIESLRSIRKRF